MDPYTGRGGPAEPFQGRPGPSAEARGVSDLDLAAASRTRACVLLIGPRATTLATARRIHERSTMRDEPFTALDCADPAGRRPDRLLDALSGRTGQDRLSTLAGPVGTLLLENIGRLPLVLQRRLATLLASPVRRRVMASNSRALMGRVLHGQFDDCLYYRLNAIQIVLGGGH
jgi:DNA-binding NtrC family response regulator